ncbi:MAG TPA: hypothetical protein VMX35_14730 [Acidobacteriota bacterium]|nr:hypothetical protein [Acidobacteriota bacterium]
MAAKDGYKILTYLHGEKTAEVDCKDRIEAHDLLTALTLKDTTGMVSASDSPVAEVKIEDLEYDKAEMWRDGELIAFGLRPEKDLQR